MSDLAVHEPPQTAVAKFDDSNPIGAMLAGVIANGVTRENVEAVTALTKLYMEVRADDAKRAYDAAFTAMQPEVGKIVAIREIPRNKGPNMKFADHFDISQHMEPILTRHGFAVSFSADTTVPGFISGTLIISHKAGHREHRTFGSAVGGAGDTPAQKAKSTMTTIQRVLLCVAFNIPVDTHDAKLVGPAITQAQADELRQRIIDSGSSLESYLRIAKVDAIEDIPNTSLKLLHGLIDEKLRQRASKPSGLRPPNAPEPVPMDLSTYDGWKAAMQSIGKLAGILERDIGGAIGRLTLDHPVQNPDAKGLKVRKMIYGAAQNGALDWATGTIVAD